MSRLLLAFLLSLLFVTPLTQAQPSKEPWTRSLGSMAIQDGGRIMPLDTYARSLAVSLTGRTYWSGQSGPEGFTNRSHMELLCDLMFKPQDLIHKPLIIIENADFKKKVGLDASKRFFSATELVGCQPISDILGAYEMRRAQDSGAKADPSERIALDIQTAVTRIDALSSGQPLAIVPAPHGKTFGNAGLKNGDPGAEAISQALTAFGTAYLNNGDVNDAATKVVAAVNSVSKLDAADARAVSLELFYNHHKPWRKTAVAYCLTLVLLGVSRLTLRKPLVIAAALSLLWGIAEHITGLSLRVAILGRAPVSNTYEALLWMGLVGIAVGGIAQLINRRAYYMAGGIAVALLSVLFSQLVPLESQTNSLPAVLRSNYWLIVHVLTITASYGVLAVAAILGHVYLAKEVLFRRSGQTVVASKLAHPLVSQTYRCLQLGLVLLTAGTILGGVWAADSWGRFWGWDPKETWALISIVVYFAVLHARYVRWLKDFGLAAAAVLGFASIVWTFYGVNYLMGAGLHSYGFGAGGGTWVGIWVIFEVLFVIACRLRLPRVTPAPAQPAQPAPAPAGMSAPSLGAH